MSDLPLPADLVGDSHVLHFERDWLSQSYEVTSYDGVSYAPFCRVTFEPTFHLPDYVDYLNDDTVREYLEERSHIVDKFLEDNFDVDNDSCSGIPFWTLEFYPKRAVTVADETTAVNAVWDHSDLVRFINEMDPGTFGAPYTGGRLTEMLKEYDKNN